MQATPTRPWELRGVGTESASLRGGWRGSTHVEVELAPDSRVSHARHGQAVEARGGLELHGRARRAGTRMGEEEGGRAHRSKAGVICGRARQEGENDRCLGRRGGQRGEGCRRRVLHATHRPISVDVPKLSKGDAEQVRAGSDLNVWQRRASEGSVARVMGQAQRVAGTLATRPRACAPSPTPHAWLE